MHRTDTNVTSCDRPGAFGATTVEAEPQGSTGPEALRRSRRQRGVALAAAVVVILGFVGVSCTKNAQAFQSVQLVNSSRNAHGLRDLAIDDTLVEKAQAWAEHMAAVGGISHSVLTDGAGSNWRVLGENVGMGSSIPQVHTLYMNSAPHRENILNGAYNRIGVGVAAAGGRYYVAQVFAG